MTMKCTKPNCDCVEKAEAANGGNPVKSYPCLMASPKEENLIKSSKRISSNTDDKRLFSLRNMKQAFLAGVMSGEDSPGGNKMPEFNYLIERLTQIEDH